MPNLYVTEAGALVEREAAQVLVTRHGEVLFSAPATRIDTIVLVGNIGVTTPALTMLLDRGIGLVLLSASGVFRGRLTANLSKFAELRHRQHLFATREDQSLDLARALVVGKIRNCRTLCMRWDETQTAPQTAELERLADRAATADSSAELMGIEGTASRIYYSAMRVSIRPPWTFTRRARRPPPDPVNALLSLSYTLLHENCYAALESVGLDPYWGFLHRPQYGRASLALDLMEEFRPVIADLVTLRLLNLRMVSPDDFEPDDERGGVRLTRDGWKQFAKAYNRRLQTRVEIPGMNRKTTYQRLLEVQARRLRSVILDEQETYLPFLAQ